MAELDIRNIQECDEERRFEKGRAQILKLAGGTAGLFTFEPGWRWTKHMSKIVGTDTCQLTHLGYCLSGRLHVEMDDGESGDFGPGDFVSVAPGHDAWVVGNEPCTMIDFAGAQHYAEARPPESRRAARSDEPKPMTH